MSVESEIAEIKTKTEDHYENFKEMKEQNREDHGNFYNILGNINKEITINNSLITNHLAHDEIEKKHMWQVFMLALSSIISVFTAIILII